MSETTKKRGLKRVLIKLLTIALVAYICWVVILYSKQDVMLFPRGLAGGGMPEATFPQGITRVWLPLEGDDRRVVNEQPTGNTIEAWMYTPIGMGRDEQRPAVVFAHGNGELIDDMYVYAERWLKRGYIVLTPEYRGYGRSKGEPSQSGIVADYALFTDWLKQQPEVDAGRIVYHGRSLGTGVVSQLAASDASRRPAAMVLESPFTSVAAFANRFGVPGFIVRNPFRTDAVLPGLAEAGTKVVVVHSPHDEIVPYSHGKRLAEITPGARLVDLTGSHVGDLCGQAAYWDGVDETLEAAALPGSPSRPPLE